MVFVAEGGGGALPPLSGSSVTVTGQLIRWT
jgi:hypothetical protein